MFDIQVDGASGLTVALEHLAEFPPEVRKAMVKAKADIVAEALEYNAATMLQGPYNQYGVARSVTVRKPTATKTGGSCRIDFAGEQHGNRLAEIAFINEYGKKNQPARPFIKKSIKDTQDLATKAAYDVLDRYIKGLGL